MLSPVSRSANRPSRQARLHDSPSLSLPLSIPLLLLSLFSCFSSLLWPEYTLLYVTCIQWPALLPITLTPQCRREVQVGQQMVPVLSVRATSSRQRPCALMNKVISGAPTRMPSMRPLVRPPKSPSLSQSYSSGSSLQDLL